ncbi:Type II secretory pathway, component ExeA (predicted ATPase) [Nitrosospira sp. Nsp18]|nr:Type II secretory pathway, component ExeA (predicted ATPase) [Nitrosospira sp. Nsp18]
MYPGHFGFSEQPFADSSVTDFFYEGANRGATLDALIYVLTHGEGVEGIIQVIGADGSGKTTLCRSLIKRLPAQMQAVYLAKPDFSREEFLHSIMNELNPGGTESATTAVRATGAIEELQRALTEKHAGNGQVVLLVDEAHILSAEVLEEALALYDLESPRHKLLQIVLFGQVELENKLASPQMRRLNDRVTHRFALQPFNTKAVEEYLVRRVGTAGYPHADIFSAKAVKLISRASGGLVRQIDILADKSLLAASIAETREVDAHQVNAAVEDSGIKRSSSGGSWQQWRVFLGHCTVDAVAVFSTVAVVALGVLGWHDIRSPSPEITSLVASMPLEATTPAPVSIPAPGPVYSTMVTSIPPSTPPSVSAAAAAPSGISRSVSAVASTPAPPEAVAGIAPSAESKPAAEIGQRSTARTHIAGVELAGNALLEQRLEVTTNTMRKTDKNFYTIQLFATENIQPDRMERFLLRARSQVDLSDLYVHPVSNGDQAKFIVTYGIYPSRDEADAAVAGLPEKYQSSFQPALFALSDLH